MRRGLVVAVVMLAGALGLRVAVGSVPAAGVATSTTTTTTTVPNLAAVHAKLVPVVTGLDHPVALAWRPGDGRMYVAEQTGHVRIVSNGVVTGTVLNLTVSHGGEQGLLGITFSRDGTKLYADYTGTVGNSNVVEWTMTGDKVDPTTRRQILFQTQPFANHNGGQVTIGSDNMLYIGFGDGGGAGDPQGNGQKLSTWLGKILRIDPRPSGTAAYQIPPGNPFVGQAGARPEIWMYGLRNPWRWSIDRLTGAMWIGDVGQNSYEEVDYAPAGLKGVNWGWNLREGLHPYNGGARPPGARDPIIERAHTSGDCAVIGGYVYRGKAISSLGGAYVYGDLCTGALRAAVQSGGVVSQQSALGLTVTNLVSFGEGPIGELFAVSGGGTVYKLVPS